MSYRTIDWVYNQQLPAQDKLILVYIAKCENEQGPCFASVKLLAAKCGVSARTVQRILKKLCEAGLVSSTPRFRTDGSQTSNFYTINVERDVTAMSPPHDIQLTGGDVSRVSPPDATQMSGLELPNKTKSKPPLPSDTSPRHLVYPQGLTKHSKDSVGRILQGIPTDAAQTLLDELAGAMAAGFIKKGPEYWLSGVAMKYRAGQFKPNLGLEIAKNRRPQASLPSPNKLPASEVKVDRGVGNRFLAQLRPQRTP